MSKLHCKQSTACPSHRQLVTKQQPAPQSVSAARQTKRHSQPLNIHTYTHIFKLGTTHTLCFNNSTLVDTAKHGILRGMMLQVILLDHMPLPTHMTCVLEACAPPHSPNNPTIHLQPAPNLNPLAMHAIHTHTMADMQDTGAFSICRFWHTCSTNSRQHTGTAAQQHRVNQVPVPAPNITCQHSHHTTVSRYALHTTTSPHITAGPRKCSPVAVLTTWWPHAQPCHHLPSWAHTGHTCPQPTLTDSSPPASQQRANTLTSLLCSAAGAAAAKTTYSSPALPVHHALAGTRPLDMARSNCSCCWLWLFHEPMGLYCPAWPCCLALLSPISVSTGSVRTSMWYVITKWPGRSFTGTCRQQQAAGSNEVCEDALMALLAAQGYTVWLSWSRHIDKACLSGE